MAGRKVHMEIMFGIWPISLYILIKPLRLSSEQVPDYLFLKKKSEDVSKTFFILTVHALRAACRIYDLPYEQFKLSKLPSEKKSPVVLNISEARSLLTLARAFLAG
ncbi:hypothetical protein SAMN05192529_105152 [Arachidicoccus rhizosphaerae]|uniref:Uncharacterized protein n=1 Tax=Arachidicoccus rhizosphaerae TaxID=551991 RepID=A0A1H3XIL3_9BACT|nr:hypothetical protein SAMN05192529_105152 [Arachidicoccus rhizosphaerae]